MVYALANGYAIVTKDADFGDLASLRTPRLKVVWLRLGNCTVVQTEQALRANHEAIQTLLSDPEESVLTVL